MYDCRTYPAALRLLAGAPLTGSATEKETSDGCFRAAWQQAWYRLRSCACSCLLRRQMFANAQLARAAAEKEIEEARARTAAQRALADAQAQAAQRTLTVARERAANEAKSDFMSLMCHEVRAGIVCRGQNGAPVWPYVAHMPPGAPLGEEGGVALFNREPKSRKPCTLDCMWCWSIGTLPCCSAHLLLLACGCLTH